MKNNMELIAAITLFCRFQPTEEIASIVYNDTFKFQVIAWSNKKFNVYTDTAIVAEVISISFDVAFSNRIKETDLYKSHKENKNPQYWEHHAQIARMLRTREITTYSDYKAKCRHLGVLSFSEWAFDEAMNSSLNATTVQQ